MTEPAGGEVTDPIDLLRRFVNHDTFDVQHRMGCQDDPCPTCEGFNVELDALYDEARAMIASFGIGALSFAEDARGDR